jgi:molybdopterin-guanine dinucleotide biosynthesis protein A
MQITGIILAGGKSKRMGTDKVLMKLEGEVLLKRAIKLCQTVCASILISSNNPNHSKYGFEIIADEMPDCGPIGGIYSCLRESQTEWNFILSVDSPFVKPEFVSYLVSEIKKSDAVVPIHSKGKEPLIAMYHKNSLQMTQDMLEMGNFKMQNLLNTINTKFVDSQHWVKKYPDLFRNLNRPEDFVV